MKSNSTTHSLQPYSRLPSESSTSHSSMPAQQGPEEASTSSSQLQHDKSTLMELPAALHVNIARHLDRLSRANLRLTNKALRLTVNEVVDRAKVNNSADLRAAIETYKEGGLTTLTLTSRNIKDNDLLLLRELAGLRRLNLIECINISDTGFAHLENLSALQYLNLSFCNGLTNAGLAHLKNLSALQYLNLSFCNGLTGTGFFYLRNLSSLRHLNLYQCRNILDDEVEELRELLINCSIENQPEF